MADAEFAGDCVDDPPWGEAVPGVAVASFFLASLLPSRSRSLARESCSCC